MCQLVQKPKKLWNMGCEYHYSIVRKKLHNLVISELNKNTICIIGVDMLSLTCCGQIDFMSNTLYFSICDFGSPTSVHALIPVFVITLYNERLIVTTTLP